MRANLRLWVSRNTVRVRERALGWDSVPAFFVVLPPWGHICHRHSLREKTLGSIRKTNQFCYCVCRLNGKLSAFQVEQRSSILLIRTFVKYHRSLVVSHPLWGGETKGVPVVFTVLVASIVSLPMGREAGWREEMPLWGTIRTPRGSFCRRHFLGEN